VSFGAVTEWFPGASGVLRPTGDPAGTRNSQGLKPAYPRLVCRTSATLERIPRSCPKSCRKPVEHTFLCKLFFCSSHWSIARRRVICLLSRCCGSHRQRPPLCHTCRQYLLPPFLLHRLLRRLRHLRRLRRLLRLQLRNIQYIH
jgi:hypothetical protein